MSNYVELSIDKIELDKSNPRIANYLATHDEDDITSDLMALLLGTTSDSCASLRQSIEANNGIIHPIVVNKQADGTYVVIEGNTRLQIYKDFRKANKPGNWDTIRCIIYDNIDNEEMHKIRLQAHLVGPREWDPYSKAKYLNYLANVEHMPMASLISFCGGSSKASEIRNMIAAYNDMEVYYRPLTDDDKKLYLHYLTTPRLIALLGMIDKDSPTYKVLYNYTTIEFSQMYEEILRLVCERESQQNYVFRNFLYFFGKDGVSDLLKMISHLDFSVDTLLKKWDNICKQGGVTFIDFELIRIYHRFIQVQALSDNVHLKCNDSILQMDMDSLALILYENVDSFQTKLSDQLAQEKGHDYLMLTTESIVNGIQQRLKGLLGE